LDLWVIEVCLGFVVTLSTGAFKENQMIASFINTV